MPLAELECSAVMLSDLWRLIVDRGDSPLRMDLRIRGKEMPNDNSRRNFLRKAAYVPPILLSFHAVPSFARPGSVQVPSPRPGIVNMPPDSGVRSMKPPAGPSTDVRAKAAEEFGGASGGRVFAPPRDLPHQSSVASTSGGGQTPTLSAGALGDSTRSESEVGAMKALFSKLWKSGT